MTAGSVHIPPGLPTADQSPHGVRPRRRRHRREAAIAGAALLVAAVLLALTNPFESASRGSGTADNTAPTSLTAIVRRTLSSQEQVNGTLGYEGSYTILNNATGFLTRLPSAGVVIKRGEPIYRLDGKPVVLLYGHTPAYRALSEGSSGADVKELNANLVRLGYATWSDLGTDPDYFSSGTATAVDLLQSHLGVTETGSLGFGDAVFLPGPLRITAVTATLGAQVGPGSPLATASSTRRHVTVALDATQHANVKAGDHVDITLPDQSITPGIVSSVGTVATSGQSGTTVDIEIRPLLPRATGSLDKAPVQVAIMTGTARNALVVPVNALLALASGGYAVEVAGPRGIHRLLPVTLGLFDDADGLVQIEGSQLRAGQEVVVPTSS